MDEYIRSARKNILLRVLLKDVTGTNEYNYERKKILIFTGQNGKFNDVLINNFWKSAHS